MNDQARQPPVYADLLRASLNRNADRPCFHAKRGGTWRTWTYAEFHRGINRMTDALKKAGFGFGHNGVVIGENSPEWVIAYHSYFFAGGCTVPIDPHLPLPEIREIVRLTTASFVACSKELFNVFKDIGAELSCIKKTLVLDGPARGAGETFDGFCSTGDESADAPARPFFANDTTVIIFTSGTTGKAKGVALNQRNFTTTPLHVVPRMNVGPADTMLAALPLHHVFGAAACITGALCAGMDLVFVPSVKGPLILEALRDKRVTILPAVPKMVSLFYDAIERSVRSKGLPALCVFRALMLLSFVLGPILGRAFQKKLFSSVHAALGGKLNLIVSGGASLQKKYFNGFRGMGFTIVEGYGLTETFGPITLCPGNHPRLGSVGPVLPDNEMKIHEPDISGVGEVLFRGAAVFKGYYNDDAHTKTVFDEQSWFHTGDVGKTDSNGYLYLSGRIKDLIVLESGKNAYPDEIEDYFSTSELIEEIGVFGVRVHDTEIIAALIVPAASVVSTYGADKAGDVIYNEVVRMGRNLPSYKKPADFAVVKGPLPRTTTQKLKKHELRQMYYARRDASGKIKPPSRPMPAVDTALLSTMEYQRAARHIGSLADAGRYYEALPSHHLELDAGLDSMRRVELFCRLEEEFSIVFPEDALLKTQTVGDLCRLVMELKSPSLAVPEAVSAQTLRQRMSGASAPDIALPGHNTLFSDAIPRFAFSLSKALWGLAVSGAADFQCEGPVIFCANHGSYIDILWLLYVLPYNVRVNTFTTGKSEVLKSPVLSPFLKNIPFIPVERGGDVVKALRLSAAALKKGKNLIIFPEGGRSRTGRMKPFKAGIGILMLETNASVVPVKIKGSYDIWPAGKLPRIIGGRRFGPSVTFGERLTLQKLIERGKLSPYSTDEQIAACIQNIVEEM